MKKHGHYCKICGEYKANEKFSGKGHAAHICKTCSTLPPEKKAEMLAINRLLNLPWQLSKEQKDWLRRRTHDRRTEVKALAQQQYEVRFPGFIMGYYLVSTTTVSEFVAAMEKMHIPQKIVIPMSVVFRFFPTVKEEYATIRDAMKIRGITTLRSPVKMLEYRVVPLMMSIAKIGEELSAAALTRGLGAPQKRTNICKIGFGPLDIFFFLLAIPCWVGFFIC